MRPHLKWIIPVLALVIVLLLVVGRRPRVEETPLPVAEPAPEHVPAPEPMVDIIEEPAWPADEIEEPVLTAPEAPSPVEEEWPVVAVDEEEAPAPDPDLPDRPDFIASTDEPLRSSPKDERVRELAVQIQMGSGPEALEQARALLASDKPDVGYVAAAILMGEPAWDLDVLESLESHSELGVPLYAWQGLRDAGRYNDAAALQDTLFRRLNEMENWADWIGRAGLPGTAVRGLLDAAGNVLNADQYAEVLDALVVDDSVDYAGRMRALLAYQESLPFEQYRDRVYAELERVDAAQDQVWSEGVVRLAERLEGPVEVHTDTQVIVPQNVDLMLAREYPAMYEDLALMLEQSMERADVIYAEGLIARLDTLMEQSQRIPLSSSDRNALQRIRTLMGQIQESDISHLPPMAPPMAEVEVVNE